MATPNNENPIYRDGIDHQNEIQREMDVMILTVFEIKEAIRGRREHSTLVRVRELHRKATSFLKEVKAEKDAGLLDSSMVKLEPLDEENAVTSLAAIPLFQPAEKTVTQLPQPESRQAIFLQTVKKTAGTLPSAPASATLPPTSATSGSGSAASASSTPVLSTLIPLPKVAASIPAPARPSLTAEKNIKQPVPPKKVVKAAAAPLKPLNTPWREG
jgi:hypothetical protein